MQTSDKHLPKRGLAGGQRRYYRVERQFSTERRPEEFLRDLLRAHCGE